MADVAPHPDAQQVNEQPHDQTQSELQPFSGDIISREAEPDTLPVAPSNEIAFGENATLPERPLMQAAANDSLESAVGSAPIVEDAASGIAPIAPFIPEDVDVSQATPSASQHMVDSAADVDSKMEDAAPEPEVKVEDLKVSAPHSSLGALPNEEVPIPALDGNIDSAAPLPDRTATAGTNADQDQIMAEALSASVAASTIEAPNESVQTGTVRPREDDEVEEPLAKRSKVEDQNNVQPEFKVPELPEKQEDVAVPAPASITNGHVAEVGQAKPTKPTYSTSPLTPAQRSGLLDRMKNLKKVKSAMWFLKPVDIVTLNIPSYPEIVKQPMDLSTMERKLKENAYASIAEFVADFELIVGNALLFNGSTHVVTTTAQTMEAYFRKQMETLPRADAPAPQKAVKKQSSPAAKTSASRRESRSAAAPAQSPGAGGAFALQPDGTPQIRRDSGTNRPSRAIRPPPNREVTYAKPKRKAYQMELKFCEHVLDDLRSARHQNCNIYFLTPVDPVALNIPHYHSIIKEPMDMQTMSQKLKQGQYEKASEFKADFELMVQNCMTFNPPPNLVRDAGVALKGAFDQLWKEKSRWEKRNQPASQRASSASADESEGDESEEDEDGDEENSVIAALQKQLADIQATLANTSKSVKAKDSKKNKHKKKESKGGNKSSSRKIGSLSAAPARSTKPKANNNKRPRQVTYDEKQEISNSVERMDGAQVEVLSKLIMANSEKHANMVDEEMELEIDDLPNHLQFMLLKHVRSIFGAPNKTRAMSPDDLAAQDDDDFEPERPPRNAGAGKRKKHKPMSKKEQMEQMAVLREKIGMFTDGAVAGTSGSDSAAHAVTTTRQAQPESSGDDESEESEEE